MFLRVKLCGGKFGQKQRGVRPSFKKREIPGDGQDVSSNIKLMSPSAFIKINKMCTKTLAHIRKKKSQ